MDVEAVLERLADAILRWDRQRLPGKPYGSTYGILLVDQLELRAFREMPVDPHSFDFGTPGLYRRAYAPRRQRKPRGERTDLFDSRVGHHGSHAASRTDIWFILDPEWAPRPPMHLDRFQRSRIRRVLRNVPPGHARLRSLTRWTLAAQYGIRIADVLELERVGL